MTGINLSLVLEVNLSLFSGKMEGPLKAPVSTLPSHFFVLFRENVCANEVFSHDKCPRIQFSIQESPFHSNFMDLADIMKDCSIRFTVTTACVLIGLHLPGRSKIKCFKILKNGLKAKLHPQAQWALDVVC